MDWGQALASGIAAGAGGVAQQQQDQQKEQDWLEKQKQLMAMQSQQQQAKERYLMALSPPKTDKQTITDESGKAIDQNRQWIPPTDADIAAGKSGHFEVTGSAPNINFERLDETQRNNDLKNQNAQDRLALLGQYNAARIDAATARRDAANARAEAGGRPERAGVMQFVPVPGKPGETMPVISDGKGGYTPYTQDGKPMQGRKAALTATEVKQRQQEAADAKAAQDQQTEAMNPPGILGRAWNSMTGNSAANAPQADAGPPASMAGPMAQFTDAKPAPGSSPATAITYQPGMPKPPSGTYVRKPDGTIVRVP